MKHKIERVTVDGETRYRVYQRKSIFSKWVHVIYKFEGTGERLSELTALQLGMIEGLYWELPNDIKKEVRAAEGSEEVKDHVANLYSIQKWVDPEHTRCTERLCGAGEIGDLSDGYHTFNELYDFRREYNAALVNSGVWKAHKSHRHNDGELCFGGGWFIVMMETPYGQISNHYEDKYWDEFHCEERETADKWDGHTDKDVLERLMKCNLEKSSIWKQIL